MAGLVIGVIAAWPFGALGFLYEVVQNSADRGFSRTTAPGRLGKISICAV